MKFDTDLDIIVLTNEDAQYEIMTENLLLSFERVGVKRSKISLHKIDLPSGVFGTKEFNCLTLEKLRVVHEYLVAGKTILLCDVDIVMLKNPLPYVVKELESHDLVFQNEGYVYQISGKQAINTGFFAVKSSKKTIDLFNIEDEVVQKKQDLNDQDLINLRLNRNNEFKKFKIKVLPEEDFPCGRYWFQNHKGCSPYLVHYNFLKGSDRKLEKMQEFKHFYVDDNWYIHFLKKIPAWVKQIRG